MILGTVELGLEYGINNQEGKPSQQQAFNVLSTAWNTGIRHLDTAAAYGDSEEIIGNYHKITGNRFDIDTKLPADVNCLDYKEIFKNSCNHLNVDKIYTLYLHSFNDCKNKSSIAFLKELKASGKICHIGVSIYDPAEMEYLVQNVPEVDVIQFPFNVFDNSRWNKSDLLNRVISAGTQLIVRSVFLQGLLFKPLEDNFIKSIGAEPYLEGLQQSTSLCEMSTAEFAYKYVKSFKGITDIILGCQTPEEVVTNFAFDSSDSVIPKYIISEINKLTTNIPDIIINPRRWKRI